MEILDENFEKSSKIEIFKGILKNVQKQRFSNKMLKKVQKSRF